MKTSELKEKYKKCLQILTEEIQSQKSSKIILDYFDFCSRFHKYSLSNQLLIWMAIPETTHVAGFHTWKKLGRKVKKGEKGIPIFAPIWVKRKPKKNHEGITEENEQNDNEKDVMLFRVVYVWDISQTEGKALPEPPDAVSVSGTIGNDMLSLLERYTSAEGIKLNYNDSLPHDAHGMSMNGQVVILSSLTDEQKFHALVHELAHEHLHKSRERLEYSKKLKETEAEATAYIVCHRFGLKPKSSTYLAIYQTEEIDIQGSFDRITKTASRILKGMESMQINLKKAA